MSSASTPPAIPEKSYENPFQEETYLHETFGDVLSENRDIVIVIDDILGRRGTGKTVTGLKLIDAMDQTDMGITYSKTSIQPEQIRNAYSAQPNRSGLMLDEGEVGASNRKAMSNTNQALREIMSMGRVEEKYVVINAPIKGFIDKDLQKLADIWITMVRKGLGLVHQLKWEPYSEQLLTPKKQWLKIDDIEKGTQLRDVYNKLTKEKQDIIGGGEQQKFVPVEEHEERIQKVKKEVRRDRRNEILQDIFGDPDIGDLGLTQQMVADAIGVDPSTVSRVT